MTSRNKDERTISLHALCRMAPGIAAGMGDPAAHGRLLQVACAAILAGTLCYGFTMGIWRSPLQGLYSALKMPLLFFAVVAASALINTMLAQVMGARLSLRAVCMLILTAMAVTAILLGALSPVALFFTLQVPAPADGLEGLPVSDPAVQPSLHVFRMLLLLHVGIIGLAGLVGNLKLLHLLVDLLKSRRHALRVLAAWILVTGFVGCELSWLFSPFLCKPNFPAHFVARTYSEGNFYEHIYHALLELP